jgi:hypothetical protein
VTCISRGTLVRNFVTFSLTNWAIAVGVPTFDILSLREILLTQTAVWDWALSLCKIHLPCEVIFFKDRSAVNIPNLNKKFFAVCF